MTTPEIIAIIATGIVSMFGFLLRNAVNSVTDRLDILAQKVDNLTERFAAASVRSEVTVAEIDRFRQRLHELSGVVMEVQVTQKNCKQCRGE